MPPASADRGNLNSTDARTRALQKIVIPSHWDTQDRKSYAFIGNKRKQEHVLCYAFLGITAQLYHHHHVTVKS